MTPLGVFLRGVLMGAADIVPGVSGGTMAFITGIYDRLLASIRAFDLQLLRLLHRGDLRRAWEHVDGAFLLTLVAGIATSILSLARVIAWLLETYPVPLWAFFFGLILASALVLLRQVPHWSTARVFCLTAGLGVAAAIALSPVVALPAGLPAIFIAGFIAICAMILPGISGSFILILLGMYATVLHAVKNLELAVMLVFALGAGLGLMCFSRVLHWLLRRYHAATMALLTGFLFGSLLVVWPWKHPLDWVLGSDGVPRPAQQVPVLPWQFANEPWLVTCLILMVFGFTLVWVIERRWGGS
jgi:putative membrane protein